MVQEAAKRPLGASLQQVIEGRVHRASIPLGAEKLLVVGFAPDDVDVVVELFLYLVAMPLLCDGCHVACRCITC